MQGSNARQPLYTIGYEGLRLERFAGALKAAEVARLIDIRCVPVSRKPGFSKHALAREMQLCQVDYIHMGALGNPKLGREAARNGDFSQFRRLYLHHLRTDDAQAALRRAVALALEAVSCLLCFELDHQSCHRTLVAKAMAQRGDFVLTHLYGHNDERTNCQQYVLLTNPA